MADLQINLGELQSLIAKITENINSWEDTLKTESGDVTGSKDYWNDSPGVSYRTRMNKDISGSTTQKNELKGIRDAMKKALTGLATEQQRLQAGSKVISGSIGIPHPGGTVSAGSSGLKVTYAELDSLIAELNTLLEGDVSLGSGGQYSAWKRCVQNRRSLNYSSVGPEDYDSEISSAMEELNGRLYNFRDLLVICRENIESAENSLTAAIAGSTAFTGGTYKAAGKTGGEPQVKKNSAIQIKAAAGKNPSYCQDAGDPVNMATGNFHTQKEDLTAGGKPELKLERTYNALGNGNGWNFHFDTRLCLETEDVFVLRLPEGREEIWRTGESGEPECESGGKGILTVKASGRTAKEQPQEAEYIYSIPDGETYGYDRAGLCLYLERDGRKIRFTYDDEYRLIRAENNKSHISFTYEENDDALPGCMTPVSAEDHTGRKVSYRYETGEDGTKRLVGVTRADGSAEAYGYDENGRLRTMTDAKNVCMLVNEYDVKGRTVRQTYPDGSVTETLYDDENRTVTEREKDGSEIRYKRDERYRTTEILYADGTKESYRYNGKNRRISGTDRLGRETRYAYDREGRITMVRDALGTATHITYDANGKVLSVKKAGVTVLKNTYDSHGNLICTEDAGGNRTLFSYERGLPVRITDADGKTTELRYDDRERVQELTDPAKGLIRLTYDDLDRICGTEDIFGRSYGYGYDPAGRLVKSVRPDGAAGYWSYDAGGKAVEFRDYDGNCLKRSYTVMGKPEADEDKAGRKTSYAYDVMWNLASVTYPDGGKEEREYDSEGHLIRKTFPDGGTAVFCYDACGNVVSVTDGTGNTTSYEYDALNRAVKVIFADGRWISRKFDAFGCVTEETDTAGGVTVHTYDAAGRRLSTTNPVGDRIEWSYTPAGKPEKTVYPGGLTEQKTYSEGRLVRLDRADGNTEEYSYDEAGRLTGKRLGSGYTVTYVYDILDRITEIYDSEGKVQNYGYDVLGHVKEVRDALGNVTRYDFDVSGNLIKVTDACGHETEYGYNELDQLIEIRKIAEDGTASVTSYERNHAGQLTAAVDAAGHREQYAYDANGRLIRKQDADGFETLYTYNVLGMTECVRFGDGTENTYRYDALRRLSEFTDSTGVTRLVNDAVGRVLRAENPDGNVLSYEWGRAGERKALVYPDGRRAEYSYDEKLRLTGLEEVLSDGTRRQVADYDYDAFGRLTEKRAGNGITTRFGYRADGLLEELISFDISGRIMDSFRYAYDTAGNKVGEERNRGTEESFRYIYDPMGRLTQVERNNELLRSYNFDAFGNQTMLEDRKDGTRTGYIYGEGGQLLKEISEKNAEAAGTESTEKTERTYAYDGRGNLTEVRENGELKRSYLYGASGRLARAQRHGSTGSHSHTAVSGTSAPSISEYFYNGLGMRTGRRNIFGAEDPVIAGGMTGETGRREEMSYLLDMTRSYNNMLSLRDGSGQETLFINDGLTAEAISVETGRREIYVSDVYGSPVRITDGTGNTTGLYGYEEYGTRADLLVGISMQGYASEDTEVYASGDAKACASDILRPFTFTGYMEDEVSGLYYAQAREYDPASGRFAGRDWVKGFTDRPYTLNEYGYCWNDPLMYVDRDGRMPTTEATPSQADTSNRSSGGGWPTAEEIGAGIKNAADELYHDIVGHTIVYNQKEIAPGVTVTDSGHTGGSVIDFSSNTETGENTINASFTPVNLLGHSVYVKISLNPKDETKSSVTYGFKYSAGEDIGSISNSYEAAFYKKGMSFASSVSTKVTAQELQLKDGTFDPAASYSRSIKVKSDTADWGTIGLAIGTVVAAVGSIANNFVGIVGDEAAAIPAAGAALSNLGIKITNSISAVLNQISAFSNVCPLGVGY